MRKNEDLAGDLAGKMRICSGDISKNGETNNGDLMVT